VKRSQLRVQGSVNHLVGLRDVRAIGPGREPRCFGVSFGGCAAVEGPPPPPPAATATITAATNAAAIAAPAPAAIRRRRLDRCSSARRASGASRRWRPLFFARPDIEVAPS
jgi:hypothetical protein